MIPLMDGVVVNLIKFKIDPTSQFNNETVNDTGLQYIYILNIIPCQNMERHEG